MYLLSYCGSALFYFTKVVKHYSGVNISHTFLAIQGINIAVSIHFLVIGLGS